MRLVCTRIVTNEVAKQKNNDKWSFLAIEQREIRLLSTRTKANDVAKHKNKSNEVAKHNNTSDWGPKDKNNDKWCCYAK